MLDGCPPYRRDVLVVLDGRHAALAVVLPVGRKGKQALHLGRVGRRLLLGRLNYATMVGGSANRFVVSRPKVVPPLPLRRPQMVLSTLSGIGSTSPTR